MHFAHVVFTERGPEDEDYEKEIEERMMPFWQDLEVDPYIEYTKEQVIQMATEIKARIQKSLSEDPAYHLADWEKKFLTAQGNEELFKAYTEDEEVDENGNVLSTSNPNMQWDWYAIGNRWDHGLRGHNCLKASEVDFNPTEEEKAERTRFWEIIVEGSPKREDEDSEWYESLKKWNNPDYLKREYTDKGEYVNAPADILHGFLNPEGVWSENEAWNDEAPGTKKEKRIAWEKKFMEEFKKWPNHYATLIDYHM